MDDPSIGAYDNPTGRSGKGPAECERPVSCMTVTCPTTFPGPCLRPSSLLQQLAVRRHTSSHKQM